MNNKLGCLSRLRWSVFFVVMLGLLVAEILNGNAMFSPARCTPPMPKSVMTAASATPRFEL